VNSPTSQRRSSGQSFFLQVVLVVGFIFIALMLFALARSIYRDSFQVGGYIDDLESLIAIEQAETLSESDELAYARTPQFQEKMAKELLGLKSRGESVIILTDKSQQLSDLLPDDQRERRLENAALTNPAKWLRYLFGI